MLSSLMNQIDALVRVWSESKYVLVFTGAGISTASDIPDFRGPDGLWKEWRPVYYQDFLVSHQSRVEHWQFKLAGWDAFRFAQPNEAHVALADLQCGGWIHKLVTQNIDGLHQLAGSPEEAVVELHGTNRRIKCVQCGRLVDPEPVYERFRKTHEPPICDCGGFLKPATVSFGQSMPEKPMRIAFDAAHRTDLAVSVGSSLTVEPAASVPLTAKHSGAFYAIINRGSTGHDAFADLVLDEDVTRVLPEVARLLR